MNEALLSVDGLSKTYRTGARTVAALSDISFSLQPGETLGLAGPSGCGKSTLARILMRLIPAHGGTIHFKGHDWLALDGRQLRAARRHMQMVFQDTHGAFNPRASVEDAIGEPLRIHRMVKRRDRAAEIRRLLERVGLPASYAGRPVFELSGGQRQRVAIARAIALKPSLLILDEAVSALDVSVRRQILELLVEIQRETAVSCIFVSHDLAVIRAVCHRVAIMDAGRIVEIGRTGNIVSAPQSSTARTLIDAAPRLTIAT
ncbi:MULTISPECIES: ABC transporter ATP-binding protein [Agrobacterium]|uniref:Dipeptide/oligopeptide/nickel ABC transporter ATP-binding protein n=1 Tax=Agrobacterium tumefaciens TaxID=358 RepID=A0AAF0H2P0_AGRTU|nr:MULTISPECIES: dipeptide/oligopeptide/nickel ABC transporter ATP-binding protein [Agrobacterium]WGM62074.1 dipeptide/oligopeptide/nickel ABC transporter ATP-binding protein [Agrobacterium tumefaciens]CVI64704.1 Oligopeptide ABC transporter nucleotide binding/ATPase protein [Agrobacterium salinitolerans str. Hayward 0363]